jgi:GDPmannose 4,6-dehydratase
LKFAERTALVTGVGGQDGAYLARFLLGKSYRVVGTLKPGTDLSGQRLVALGIRRHPCLHIVHHDMGSFDENVRLLSTWRPCEAYNLAAHSSVAASFRDPLATARTAAWSPLALLEAIRLHYPQCRVFQASSSEMFGRSSAPRLHESSPFAPLSPYASGKVYAHCIGQNYREAFQLFVSCGILFNHESRLRSPHFVTRKVAAAAAANGAGQPLEIGNLDAVRDWGYAPEYVRAMWLMLQAKKPRNYVIATGIGASVREFVTHAFRCVNVSLDWSGDAGDEVARCTRKGRVLVRVKGVLLRPADVNRSVGDASAIHRDLGWRALTDWRGVCRLLVNDALGGGR